MSSLVCLALSASAETRLVVRQEKVLPEQLRWTYDVRWFDTHVVELAAHSKGIVRLNLDEESSGFTPLYEPSDRLQAPRTLGTSAVFAVGGSVTRAVNVLDRASGALQTYYTIGPEEAVFDFVLDLDVQEDKLLVSAPLRNGDEYAPDGAVLWLASLEEGLEKARSVYVSIDGPGAKRFGRCGMMDVTRVRFMPDGSSVFVPGIEPGIFYYSKDGELTYVWNSEAIGVDATCEFGKSEGNRYAGDYTLRHAWVSQRRVVDEVLPLESGPALLVRTVQDRTSRWVLMLLEPGRGGAVKVPVPFTVPSPTARLHADVRGNRIAFLILDVGSKVPTTVLRVITADLVSGSAADPVASSGP